MECLSVVSQFGRSRDDAGNWFGCDNSHPLFHYVLEDAYLRRNPHAAMMDPKRQVLTPANPQVFPRSRGQKRYHSFEHGGHFTSACSLMIYRDDLLFGGGRPRHALVCEPVHNLVQHLVVREKGTSFDVSRAEGEEGIDFLASEDPWFRPVMVRAGPDGAVWVVDMYRYMIEHPDWLPEEGKEELEPYYRDGADRGRIYRVYASGRKPRAAPRLDRMSVDERVGALGHASGWVRDMAHQMLVWTDAGAGAPRLREMMRSHETPVARLGALCVLGTAGQLSAELIEGAMGDPDPAVRRWAVRWAEEPGKRLPGLVAAAAKLVNDPDPQVRLQLACSLGQWHGEAAGEALAQLAGDAGKDPYMAAAVVSSAVAHFDAVAKAVGAAERPAAGLWDGLMSTAMALERRDAIAGLLKPVIRGESLEQMQALARWHEALAAKGTSAEKLAAKTPDDPLAEQIRWLPRAYAKAREALGDPSRVSFHAVAAGLVGREEAFWASDREVLAALLSPQAPADVQAAAVKAIARMGDRAGANSTPSVLLRAWRGHSPALRAAVVDALVARAAWTMELLEAVRNGRIAAVEIDAARRERLLKHSSAEVKARAREVLEGDLGSDRRGVVAGHRSVLELKGAAGRGLKPFTVHCATCHRVGDVGQDLGPNLASVRGWTAEAVLTAILDPDKAVEPRYVSYTATLRGGAQVFGIVTAESAGSIKLKGLDGQEVTVLRADVASLESSGRSLMPLGLESAMSRQEIADVIEFVRRGGAE
jgi:putative heme-binding domain-containing protein